MSIITILLFFMYTWGLGFTATKLIKKLKESDNFLERNLMRIGIGLGALPILGILLNLLHIPLDWKIFLLLSFAFPVYCIIGKVRKKELKAPQLKFRLTKSNLIILIVLLLFFATFFMYSSGAFKYPYLENDDPWSYSLSTKYASVEKNLNDPDGHLKFLDPYPPAYVSLMAILHQTSSSISWTLKFFNALIISFGIIFFYFFAKQFTKKRNIALFATFALAMLPCFFTHFIWAISFAVVLFLVVLYCLEKIDVDSKWLYPSALAVSGLMLTHPSMVLKIGILLALYFVVKCFIQRKFLKHAFFGLVGGIVISLFWWFSRWQSLLLTRAHAEVANATTSIINTGVFSLPKIKDYLSRIFSPASGTATRPYTFNDFFIARGQGMINVQVGWGVFATILLILGIVYIISRYKSFFKKENYWIPIAIVWFIVTFLNVNSATFNIPGFFSFRTWLLLAIPVALFCSLGLQLLFNIGKKVNVSVAFILVIVVVGILLTSGYQKYSLNTSMWPPGGFWASTEELRAYTWLKTLPVDTKVFPYHPSDDAPIIGVDKFSCTWCEEVVLFREGMIDKDATQLHSWLKSQDYEYLIISGMSYRYFGSKFGENKTNEILPGRIEEITTSGLFQIVHQTEGALVFKVL